MAVEDVNDESIAGSSVVVEGVVGVDVFCEDVSHLWFWQWSSFHGWASMLATWMGNKMMMLS